MGLRAGLRWPPPALRAAGRFAIGLALLAALIAPATAHAANSTATPDSVRKLIVSGYFSTAQRAAFAILRASEAAGDSARIADAINLLLEGSVDPSPPGLSGRRALAERALRIREEHTDDVAIATSLMWLGRALLVDDHAPAAARDTLERALSLERHAHADSSAGVARIKFELGLARRALGDERAARELIEDAVRTWRAARPADSSWLGRPLSALADIGASSGDSIAARSSLDRLMMFRLGYLTDLQHTAPEDPRLGEASRLLAREYRDRLHDYARADSLYRRAYAARQRLPMYDAADATLPLASVARTQEIRGDLDGAVGTLEQVLAIREARATPDSQAVADAVQWLGEFHWRSRQWTLAVPQYTRLLALRERQFGPESREALQTMQTLDILRNESGELALAELGGRREVSIAERVLPPDDLDYGLAVYTLGITLRLRSDFDEARRNLERAVPILEKNLGPNDLEVANAVRNLGLALRGTGDAVSARPLLERALAITERRRGPDSADDVLPLTGLGVVLEDLGDFATAESLFTRALGIVQRKLGPDSPAQIDALNDLASAETAVGSLPRAIAYYERGIAVMEKAGERFRLSQFTTNLGLTLVGLGEYARACDEFEKALAQARADSDAFMEGRVLSGYGIAIAYLGRPKAGRDSCARAVAIFRRLFGSDSPQVESLLPDFALVCSMAGDTAAALDHALDAQRIHLRSTRLLVEGLSEREALRVASDPSDGMGLALSFTAAGLPRRDARDVEDAIVQSRATVLDEVARRHQSVAAMSAEARELAAATTQLATLSLRGPGAEGPENYRTRLDKARERKEDAERALALTGFRDRGSSDAAIDLARVAVALPVDAALVSYVRYDRWVPRLNAPGLLDTIPSYLAFVLRPGERDPVAVPLGDARRADSLVSRWKEQVGRGSQVPDRFLSERAYRSAGDALRQAVWDPIAVAIGDAQRVFVVPDGALTLVSFATLPVGDRGYLLERGPLLHYLSAERDLVRAERTSEGTGLLALGGPDFDHEEAHDSRSRLAVSFSGNSHVRAGPFQGLRSNCAEFRNARWSALPGAVRECQEIAELWRSAADTSEARVADLATGVSATESMFKLRAPGHRVLHIATHGFFLSGSCGAQNRRPPGPAAGGVEPMEWGDVPAESPLIWSGLVLAGANRRDEARPGEEDGVLTVEEVAAMDLSGVGWAVLSACETGVGEVRAGEGVFGLRRAFQIAGARTVIMSLWSVDDNSTREWMKELYEGRLTRHLGTAEAVRAAGLEVMRERRAAGLSTHPFYWGAFVAAGDWW